MKDYTSFELSKIRSIFINFADNECKGNSGLYYQLCRDISENNDLLTISSYVKSGQPIPNSFLASVHYLLLKNPDCGLAKFYPSISGKEAGKIPFALFKSFALEHKHEILELEKKRIVQTNVISRCSYLLPVFSEIINRENMPATIIDIGTSAGLTLNFDKYEYHYNGLKTYGQSKVVVNCEVREGEIPGIKPISRQLIKIGIDQNVIDPDNEDEKLWLKALIWADQVDRFAAMDEAFKIEEYGMIQFHKGSTVAEFEKQILQADVNKTLIVYNTSVLYQFPQEMRIEFREMLDSIGQKRDLYYLCAEDIEELSRKYNINETAVELTTYKDRHKTVKLIAETNGHGNWIKWK